MPLVKGIRANSIDFGAVDHHATTFVVTARHARCRLQWTLAALFFAARVAAAETVTVGPADGSCPDAVVSRIQSALDAATPGSTIVVCAGIYEEQLVVTKPVRLRALPGATLRPPGLMPLGTSLRTGR